MTVFKPDIFGNVHKGIRKALCDACVALGRAAGDPQREQTAKAILRDALRFVAHHGENEDLLLLPLLATRAPQLGETIERAHQQLEIQRSALSRALERGAGSEVYLDACAFTSAYFDHMREEEQLHDPAIRAVLSEDELGEFARKSVERTTPPDQRMMLGYMLPAMARADAEAFLGKISPGLAEELLSLQSPERATGSA
jgi:hypothetical protein